MDRERVERKGLEKGDEKREGKRYKVVERSRKEKRRMGREGEIDWGGEENGVETGEWKRGQRMGKGGKR